MNNNEKFVVLNNDDDKVDCFAWKSKTKCNALKTKECKNCSFYKSKILNSNYKQGGLVNEVKSKK